MIANVYLATSIGMTRENVAIIWPLAQQVAPLQAQGLGWVIGVDWDCDFEATSVRQRVETSRLERPAPPPSTRSSKIDFFAATSNSASRRRRRAVAFHA